MTGPLLEEHDDGTYYVGPLYLGIKVAEAERWLHIQQRPTGGWQCELHDEPTLDKAAEWGAGTTEEQAIRYAIGALLGPLDSEYDEAALIDYLGDVADGATKGWVIR